jgi:CRP-like cAMP-binding protein
MTNAELRETLHKTPLFRDFNEQEIEGVLNLVDLVTASASQVVIRQDELGDCMYIVGSGECRVVHHKGGRDIDLAVLKAGDFFGEIALVDEGPRSADVIAVTDVSLIKISQSAIAAIAGVYPQAAFKLLIAIGRTMVQRLRFSNRRYVDSLLFPLEGKD